MIRSMYEICQVEKETVEEYMLHIHEAVVVIQCAHPERLTNQNKNFLHDCFYNGLLPSLRKPWALQWLTYWRGNKHALHLIPCIP